MNKPIVPDLVVQPDLRTSRDQLLRSTARSTGRHLPRSLESGKRLA